MWENEGKMKNKVRDVNLSCHRRDLAGPPRASADSHSVKCQFSPHHVSFGGEVAGSLPRSASSGEGGGGVCPCLGVEEQQGGEEKFTNGIHHFSCAGVTSLRQPISLR